MTGLGRRTTLQLAACASSLCMPASRAFAQDDAPPKAPVREVADTYFGTTVVDPYRWMEDLKNPETLAWMKAQSDFTRRRLDALPQRAELLKRLGELSNAGVVVHGVADAVTGDAKAPVRYFYFKLAPGEDVDKVYFRDGLDGAERLLVDPEKLREKDAHFSVSAFSPSFDGKYVSYVVAAGGGEIGEIRVIEVATGKDMGERIDRVQGDPGEWLQDGRSFVYSRLQKLAPDAPETDRYQKSRVYLHVLGTPPDKDAAVFGFDVDPAITFDQTLLPNGYAVPGTKYAVAAVNSGVSPNSAVYVAAGDTLGAPHVAWRKLADFDDDVSGVDFHGDDLFVLTYKDTPRFKILKTSATKPDLAKAAVAFPAGEGVVKSMAAASDALYVQTLDGGIGRLWRVGYDGGAPREIKLPYAGSVAITTYDQRLPGVVFSMTSWTKSAILYAFDPAKDAVVDTKLKPASPVDFSGIESVEVKAKSHDGTMIPLSIIMKKGTKRDGENPAYLQGYGAYGDCYDPYFDPTTLAWLERGGIIAVAHVRGGGEYGEDWHLAGFKATKPNTWKDFIACAEYLIREGWTKPARLSGEGASAGGVLIGNAVAERPDLFGAAVIDVGDSDILRSETSANGVPNIPEFGSFATEEGFKGLLAMDAYQKIKDKTAYPAVLLTTGINDPRVPPWMSAKMTARLQAATSSGKPVLLRVDYDAGHGIDSTKAQTDAETADRYAFLLQQIGSK